MSIRIETVRTEDFSMDFFRFGSGDKTLVILPGLSVQSVMGQAEAVAEAYRPLTGDFTVYVFDRRRDPPDSYTVDGMADISELDFIDAKLGGNRSQQRNWL